MKTEDELWIDSYNTSREENGEQPIPEYQNLKVSTVTCMGYTNMNLNLDLIFLGLKTVDNPMVEDTVHGGVLRTNPSSLRPTYRAGTVVSVQNKNKIRGHILRKNKPAECKHCVPLSSCENGEDGSTNIATEIYRPSEKGDWLESFYFCATCNKVYSSQEVNKIPHFLNQVSVTLAIEDNGKPNINIMIFNQSIKIVGLLGIEQAKKATSTLFSKIFRIPGAFTTRIPGEQPKVILDTAMKNTCFRLGFSVDRLALYEYANSETFKDIVNFVLIDGKRQAGVTIKCPVPVLPEGHRYVQMVFDPSKRKYRAELVEENPYKPKRKTQTEPAVTFIIFCSSEVIMSGRYDESMQELYPKMVRRLLEGRHQIEENIEQIEGSKLDELFSKLDTE